MDPATLALSPAQVPPVVGQRIAKFAASLPADPREREKILAKYSALRGYQFLNPKSKLHKLYLAKCTAAQEHRNMGLAMQNELSCTQVGSIDQFSVGAMCEVVKENLRQGAQPYQPDAGDLEAKEFVFERDQELFCKTVQLLHKINTSRLEQSGTKTANPQQKVHLEDRFMAESRKQMTVKEDGSLGVWGGNKYEGLGAQNQFTNFRREQSMNYFQNTHAPGHKKQ